MKNILGYLKELKKKPYGKAVFFFGFYLIFFIILFLFIGVTNQSSIEKYSNNNKVNPVSIESVLKKNYSFTYKVILDNDTYLYEGSKMNDFISFKYKDKEYFQNNTNTYVKDNEWLPSEEIIKFKYFFNEENLEKIINSAFYESKTTYESGKTIYNYLISSNTINKIINNNETDYMEEANKISISKNSDIEEIAFNLDSYCVLNKLCNKSLKISINYDDFNNIKDIENPI